MRRLFALVLCGLSLGASCDRVKRAPPPETTASTAHPAATSDALVTDELVARVVAQPIGDQWYGLYMAGKKIGWARIGLRRTRTPEPRGFATEMQALLRVADSEAAAGAELDIFETRFYDADPPYALRAVHVIERATGERPRERQLVVDGEQIVVKELERGGFAEKRRVPRSRETLHGAIAESRLDPAWLIAGRRQTFASFDTDLERDESNTVEVVEIIQQRLAGVDTKIAVLRSKSEGESSASTIRMAGGGIALETSIGGVTLKLEDATVARSNVIGFDVIGDAVPVDRAVGDPGAIARLDLVVAVTDGFELPASPRQRVERRHDGRYDVVLTNGPGAPPTPTERSAALVATAAIDFGDPDIARLARTITSGANTDRARVERLVTWVYENLGKELSTNLSSASQVEERRVGDCTEHTLLLVALARSLGIPAREVSGLVYMGDELRRFGYHAWAEVALDGRWVAVDPSWGEQAANATHVTFGYGEDSSWVATMGGVSIELR